MGARSAVFWLLLVLLSIGNSRLASAAPSPQPHEPNRAGLVVVPGEGEVITRCVAFGEEQISGYELLQASGLDVGVEPSGMGASICRIDGVGCSPPGQSCFCECMSSPCIYWSFWRQDEAGRWGYSSLGASSSRVEHGEIQAWVWAEGVIGRESEMAPPSFTFDEICRDAVSDAAVEPDANVAAEGSTATNDTATNDTVTNETVAIAPGTVFTELVGAEGELRGDGAAGQDVASTLLGTLVVVGVPLLAVLVWLTLGRVRRRA